MIIRQATRNMGMALLFITLCQYLQGQPYSASKRSDTEPYVTLWVSVTSPSEATITRIERNPNDNVKTSNDKPQFITIERNGTEIIRWTAGDSKRVWDEHQKSTSAESEQHATPQPRKEQEYTPQNKDAHRKEDVRDNRQESAARHKEATGKEEPASKLPATQAAAHQPVSQETVLREFDEYVERDPFYADRAIDDFQTDIEEHLTNLERRADKDAYISDYELGTYARQLRKDLEKKRDEESNYINTFLKRYDGQDIKDRSRCEQRLNEIIDKKLGQRETELSRLEKVLGITPPTARGKEVKWLPIIVCIASALLLTLLIIVLLKRRRNTDRRMPQHASSTASKASKNRASEKGEDAPGIVVRRKTTSILRKQSLEDVIDNPIYLPIDVSEFCDDSTVRRIYLKNSCIKSIYNMYAEDLRLAESPKEDGCMVLGRWVYDNEAREYYVSLEEVVMPGDDAIFQEYELNFGGKIKLRVTDRLRKLRVQTNLQYDLTCWVHSHPGLGVFFSNADTTVHDQLKHPTHPHFLTAIVIDILTPRQDAGIFVYKRDGNISSKIDLKRLYSLEGLYQWALESERKASIQEATFDTLSHAKARQASCRSIQLNNSAIIDMKSLCDSTESGRVSYIHGYRKEQSGQTDCFVHKMTAETTVAGEDLMGCFVKTTHLSLPTLRRVIGTLLPDLHFVLVYTTSDDMLTSIPLIEGNLCTEESYYGEQKTDELIIWTRRKR